MKNNFLIKSAFIYMIGSFLSAGLAFLTTPIFTRILSVSEYGMVAIFITWVNIFIIIGGLETESTIPIANIKYNKIEFNSYLSSILLLSSLSFILFSLIIFIFSNAIVSMLGLSMLLLVILIFQSFFAYVQQFYNSYLIQTKKPLKSIILVASFSILSTLLSIAFVIFFRDDKYIGQILGKAIIVVIYGIVVYFIIIKKSKPKINLQYWKFCLTLSIPIIFHLLSATMLSQADRIMLQMYNGFSEAGIYSFAYIIATILAILWQATNKAWVPWYFEQTKNNNTSTINEFAREYVLLFSLATISLMLLVPEITMILGPNSYSGGEKITLIVMLGIYFNFLYSFFSNFEFYKEKTKWIAIGTIGAAIINILINLLLIPTMGIIGAAIATLISYIMLFVFHAIIATRLEGYNIKLSIIIKNIGLILISFSVILFIIDYPIIRGVVLVVIMVYIFIRYKDMLIKLLKSN